MVSRTQEKISRLVRIQPAIAKAIMREMDVVPVSEGSEHEKLQARIAAYLHLNGMHEAMQNILDAEKDRRSGQTAFGEFLAALAEVIDRDLPLAAHARRHDRVDVAGASGTELVTLGDLISRAQELMSKKFAPPELLPPSPCDEWVRLQFIAPNLYDATAKRFTGRLGVRRMIQSRTLRNEHVDAHYNNALWCNVRGFIQYLRVHLLVP
jgi:hypothetical protein